MDKLKIEFDELAEMRLMIENPVFQKFLVKPMRDYQTKRKNNFFSDSLKESWRKGGQVEGAEEFFKTLKQIDVDFKNKKFEIES